MAERRLIDADALTGKVEYSKYNNPHANGRDRMNHINEHDHFVRMIINAPTVDAVEVVRCKECSHLMFSDFYGECGIGRMGIVNPDDFCSHGERRAT